MLPTTFNSLLLLMSSQFFILDPSVKIICFSLAGSKAEASRDSEQAGGKRKQSMVAAGCAGTDIRLLRRKKCIHYLAFPYFVTGVSIGQMRMLSWLAWYSHLTFLLSNTGHAITKALNPPTLSPTRQTPPDSPEESLE